ncbi:hypothetical protein AUJ14_03025 [Candidatus Micrarchaeota archaeon CG1_02_55_22]|nr:MAG: hypothetical protein AUJ14_03025 [Candidatus Micrarchaeota archaeon CG1_02_55_22]
MVMVTKRNGAQQEFDKGKITKSIVKAGGTQKEALAIAEILARRISVDIDSSQIRAMIIEELGENNKQLSHEYARYVKTIEKLAKQGDILEEIRTVIKGTATASIAGAGYRIYIEKPAEFPWAVIIDLLTRQDRVVAYRIDGRLVLDFSTKP